MKKVGMALLAVVCIVGLLSLAVAQPPDGKKGKEPGKDKAKTKDYSNSPLVTRMMAFNKKKDGKLTRDEVTDKRLHRLFDQADTNKDGVVTKEELIALAKKLDDEDGDDRRGGPGGRGGPGDGGPGGPGGRGGPGGGPGGPGGRGFGGPPRPGQILPTFLQDSLKLTASQKKQLAALQKEVDSKLAKILTDEQKKQLKEMQEGRGRGGPGGPGGRGGPGGPGGRGGPPPERPE